MIGKLNEKEEIAVKEFKHGLFELFGDHIKNILLYGSKAKGGYSKESDIDIFVLIDKEDYKIRDQIVNLAYDFLLKYGVLISPRVINIEEYKQLDRWETAFIKNLKNEGIVL